MLKRLKHQKWSYLSELRASETWGNPNALANHFLDHGADSGATCPAQYAGQVSDFLQQSQVNGVQTLIGFDGTTKTFYSPDPSIHGYPDNPSYFNAQAGTPPIIIGK